MLSVEPILERALRTSGAAAEPGRAAGLDAAAVVVEAGARGARGTGGFFSCAAPVVEEEGAGGLAAGGRVRGAAAEVEAAVRVVVVVLGLAESAGGNMKFQHHH